MNNWDTAFRMYYKWTTHWNPYGRLESWIDETDKTYKTGLVRDSDRLVFLNTLRSRPCTQRERNLTSAQKAHFANGCYLSKFSPRSRNAWTK